jgi:hypothetical protein
VYKIVGNPVLELLKMRNVRMRCGESDDEIYGGAGSFKSERAGRLLSPNPKSWHSVGSLVSLFTMPRHGK